jgi:hypothetical protein
MSELVGSVCLGLADLVTDGITYARLVHGDIAVPNKGYKAAYTMVLCFAVVATVLSLAYRLRNASLVRGHVRKLGEQGLQGRKVGRASALRQQAQQHQWELEQTHRTKVILQLALLSVAAQGAEPLRADPRACAMRPCHRSLVGCRFADVRHELLYDICR